MDNNTTTTTAPETTHPGLLARMRSWFPEPTEWLQREATLKVVDRFFTERTALLAGVLVFAINQATGGSVWSLIEPLTGLVAVPLAAAAAYEYWREKKRRFAPGAVTDFAIVAISVNQDVGPTVQAHFGRGADVHISAEQELGKKMLSPEECAELARRVARAALPYRNRTIKLVLAGPAGLCFQVGQLLAAHKFDVVPLSWARDHYQELPRLGIDDVGA